jgi:hypothetical protein
MHATKVDPTKAAWESSDFPITCETCLGDSPFVRMMKEPHGAACKVCERPFTRFRWQPGPKARYKSTVLCQMCAKTKNVCQVCIFDLQYGAWWGRAECGSVYMPRPRAGPPGGASGCAHRPQVAAGASACHAGTAGGAGGVPARGARAADGCARVLRQPRTPPRPLPSTPPPRPPFCSPHPTLPFPRSLPAGLPAEVRDRYIAQAAAAASGAGGGGGGGAAAALALSGAANQVNSAVSDVNRSYAMMEAERAMADGGVVPFSGLAAALPAAHEALLRIARKAPYYERNLAKLCSFFAKGECNRGSECPYRHEMPRDADDPLAKQSMKDRYYGTEDPLAAKILARAAGGGGGGGGGGKGGGGMAHEPPADPSITTLWIAGVDDRVSEADLR